MIQKSIGVVLCSLLACYGESLGACTFVKQDLPQTAGHITVLEGSILMSKSGKLRLTFGQDDGDNTHPLRIKNLKTGASCTTRDIQWNGLYLSADETTLLAESEDERYFFDTKTCTTKVPPEKIHGTIAVAGDRVAWNGEVGTCQGSQCECWPAVVLQMDDQCQPAVNEKESLALSQATLGVAISKKSLVESPKTDHVKLIKELEN